MIRIGETTERGRGGATFVYLKSERGDIGHLTDCLNAILAEDIPYRIVALEAEDWNGDYSPWAMGSVFPGRGADTLSWILDNVLPDTERGAVYIAGYSLAGLFALWSFYETGRFAGAVCCSGSLWYDGWDAYADAHGAPEGSLVYLSLGGREPKAKDEKLASIGDAYRRQEARCRRDISIRRYIYEMNPGGHFADPDKRMAKGMAWVLNNRK